MAYIDERRGDCQYRCRPDPKTGIVFYLGRGFSRTEPRHLKMNPFKHVPSIGESMMDNMGMVSVPHYPWACTVVHLGDTVLCRARKDK